MSIGYAEPASTVDDRLTDFANNPRSAGGDRAQPPTQTGAPVPVTVADPDPTEARQILPVPPDWTDVEILDALPYGPRGYLHRVRLDGRPGDYVLKAFLSDAGIRQRWEVWQARRAAYPDAALVDPERTLWQDGVAYELTRFYAARSLSEHLGLDGPAARSMVDCELDIVVARLRGAVAALQDLDGVAEKSGVWLHRDIKPSNVLVTRLDPLEVVLADPECLTEYDPAADVEPTYRGTPHYSAPETQSGDLSGTGDYWSIGMLVVHIGSGQHPLYLRNQPVPASSVRKRVDWHLDLPDGLSTRTLRLVRGLLSLEWHERFGDREIQLWLAGQELELPASAMPGPGGRTSPSSPPSATESDREAFVFTGQPMASPAALAAAMAGGWEASVRLVLGREAELMGAWLHRTDPARSARFVEILDQYRSDRIDPHRAVAETIWLLDADSPPTFNQFHCNQRSLRHLVELAVDGGDHAQDIVSQLFDSRAMEVLARRPGQQHLRQLDERWAELVRTATGLVHREVPGAGLPNPSLLRAHILNALLSRRGASTLAGAAVAANATVDVGVQWYQRIAADRHDTEAPAYDAVLLLSAPLAAAQPASVPPALDDWARDYLARRIAELEEPHGVPVPQSRRPPRRRPRRRRGRGAFTPAVATAGIGALAIVHLSDRLAPGLLTYVLATLATICGCLLLSARTSTSQGRLLLGLLAVTGLVSTLLGAVVIVVGPSAGLALAWGGWLVGQVAAVVAAGVASGGQRRTRPSRSVISRRRYHR